ncbi:Galactokinase/homoserine kinase protein [Dioscorea alata]|uniref:Galactokinase/homoserine kinase protein n=2 Tax=Dioscorea alata TaxID=55571 RepID=A0ACB7VXM3_DIOAL|nr:Galactokinase/homoserine kinase protein [Dioscorea alata]KAH7679551.1 Galactokinase/homoserine kinase protein [Dioscorea alata]
MALEVRARAPGKIILSGEHAVVHGFTAVAAAIDLHTYVYFRLHSTSDNDDGLVELELKDLGLVFSWPSQRLREMFSELGLPSKTCSPECLKVITSLVEELSFPEAKIGLSSGVSAFLYLYTSIIGYRPGKVRVTSDLPLGSGLGSSASFCVSVSAALLALSGAVCADNQQKGWFVMRENELELVNKWAFQGERIIHGKPSGIDNTVSTFGSMIMFRLSELTRLKSSGPIRMLITNTKVGRNTKALVAGVSERTQRHPDAMAAVFTAVDSISKELSDVIQSAAHDDVSITAKEEKLEELMEMNQGLLQCMGVSHASIETVLRTTLRYKLASKLTGAGGGGCVLTLLPTLLPSTIVDKVISELEACGFQCLKVEVGGKGLEVCFT